MAASEPNARVARWLDRLISAEWPGVRPSARALEQAIKDNNGGQGPSYQTLINLQDPTRHSRVEEHTITEIASFFKQRPADVEQQLGIRLSPNAKLVLSLDADTDGLREAALALAQLPDEKRLNFQRMISQAAANAPESASSSPAAAQREGSNSY
ncbi:hypothetical protein [Nonomuraea sp. NPDC049400]|uniref:hypothetical protein n=1 Tax=Nonomuraea sp. NPDC049400 TaxID=3364352 RepID=UPI0037A9824B